MGVTQRMQRWKQWLSQRFKQNFIGAYLAALLFLLVFAIAVNAVIIRHSQSVLRRECIKSNEAQAYRFSALMEDLILSADSAMQRLEKGTEFYDSIYTLSQEEDRTVLDSDTLVRIRAILLLQKRQDLHDLFLYLKNSELIISAGFSTASAPLYYVLNYRSDQLSYDKWLEKLGNVGGRTVTLLYAGSYPHLACLRSLPSSRLKDAPIICATVFSERVIRNRMGAAAQEGSLLNMYSEDGVLLFSTNREMAERMDAGELAHHASYVVGEDGSRYHLFVLQSEETGCYYTSAAPEAVALSPLLSTQRFQTVMNVVLIMIGLALSVLLARRLSKPVKDTVRLVRADSPDEGEAKNDFEFLRQAFLDAQMKRHELNSRVNEHRPALQQYFLYEAMMGRVKGGSNVKTLFEQYQMPYVSDFFSAVTLLAQENGSLDPSVESLLPAWLEKERIRCYAITGMEPRTVFLLNYIPDISSDRIYQLLRQFQCRYPCEICCSDCFQGIPGIHQAYRQTQKLDEYAVIWGNTKVITSEDAQGSTEFAPNENFSASAKTVIRNAMRAGGDNTETVFEALLDQYANGDEISPFAARCFINDLSFLLHQAVSRHCTEKAAAEAKWILYAEVPSSLVHFRELFDRVLAIARSDWQSSHAQEKLSQRVDAYLEAHYQDSSIGVGTMDRLFGMSSDTLSESYRQETGQGIGDALTRIRMRHVCEMLLDTEMTLDEIAQRVGILGSSSLIRLFRKTQGTTPGAYRKEHAGSEKPENATT